jgi:cell division protein FtsB
MWGANVTNARQLRVFLLHAFGWTRDNVPAISQRKTVLRESLRAFGRAIKRKLKLAAMPAFLLALTGIFLWQATQGEHGLLMRDRRQQELAQAEANLASAIAERDSWARKVDGLTPTHLDRDALDQRARELLNLADPGEIVVQYGPKDKLF